MYANWADEFAISSIFATTSMSSFWTAEVALEQLPSSWETRITTSFRAFARFCIALLVYVQQWFECAFVHFPVWRKRALTTQLHWREHIWFTWYDALTRVFVRTEYATIGEKFPIIAWILGAWWTLHQITSSYGIHLHASFVVITCVAARWDAHKWIIRAHCLFTDLTLPPVLMDRKLFFDIDVSVTVRYEFVFKYGQTVLLHAADKMEVDRTLHSHTTNGSARLFAIVALLVLVQLYQVTNVFGQKSIDALIVLTSLHWMRW